MVDQHPVAPELPADIGPGRVDRTGKTFPRGVLSHKYTTFAGRIRSFRVGVCELFVNFIGKLGLHVDGKDFIGNAIPAVIIPFRELPLDFYKLAKTYATFPAPVAIKLRHDL
jgi:hypothetical protein